MKIFFEIAGGKYESDGEVNYKYIASADSAEEAMQMYAGVDDYPFSYLRLITEDDGTRTEHTLMGDKTDAEYSDMRVRMGISYLWMLVTERPLIDIDLDSEAQLDVVQAFVKGVRS